MVDPKRVTRTVAERDRFRPRSRLSEASFEFEATLVPSTALRVLFVTIGVLAVLSVGGQVFIRYVDDFPGRDTLATLARLFDVDGEQTLPALYSTLLLSAGAFLSSSIARLRRQAGLGDVAHWRALAAVFAILALDEFASLHETAIVPLRRALDVRGGALWFTWVVPGAVAVVVFALLFAWFVMRLPPRTRYLLVAAGLTFVGGAIGIELVGGAYQAARGGESMAYQLIVTVEETLEMVGASLFVYALLDYIVMTSPGGWWRIRMPGA